MSIITVGVDLAKNVFAVRGVDEHGRPILIKSKVPREQVLSLIVQKGSQPLVESSAQPGRSSLN